MLIPKRVKWRRPHRGGVIRGKALRGNKVTYGEFGLQTLEAGWITNRQIEAARTRHDPLHQAWWSGVDQNLP